MDGMTEGWELGRLDGLFEGTRDGMTEGGRLGALVD